MLASTIPTSRTWKWLVPHKHSKLFNLGIDLFNPLDLCVVFWITKLDEWKAHGVQKMFLYVTSTNNLVALQFLALLVMSWTMFPVLKISITSMRILVVKYVFFICSSQLIAFKNNDYVKHTVITLSKGLSLQSSHPSNDGNSCFNPWIVDWLQRCFYKIFSTCEQNGAHFFILMTYVTCVWHIATSP